MERKEPKIPIFFSNKKNMDLLCKPILSRYQLKGYTLNC